MTTMTAAAPATSDLLRNAVKDIKTYVNEAVDCDSFEEYIESTPSGEEDVLKAWRALLWICDLRPAEGSNLTFADCADPRYDVAYVREMVLNGPVTMMEAYPWIKDGLKWAKGQLREQAQVA